MHHSSRSRIFGARESYVITFDLQNREMFRVFDLYEWRAKILRCGFEHARSDREKANPALQIYKAVRAFRSDVLAVAGEIIKNAEEVSVQI